MDAAVVEGFVKAFLLPRYQDPKPIPVFHQDLWDLCCLEDRYVSAAAPRGFAKSTCVTHAYLLAKMLFRESRFALIVSDTERQAMEFLGDLKAELQDNEELRATFGVRKLIKDTESDIVVSMEGGYLFRVVAKGSEQKVRGLKWRGTRPDLVIGDDLENDEIVMNPDRREKFRSWVLKALLPCGSDDCLFRLVGTVLHFDSFLERTLNDPNWVSRRFRAHADYDDFSSLLWADKFPEERLRAVRKMYEGQGIPEGYSQEYLNNPIATLSSIFRESDFLPITDEDRKKRKTMYVVADLAISREQRADKTIFCIFGVDPDGYIHVMECISGKFDALEITNHIFDIQKTWKPELFGIEKEKISQALGPYWSQEMRKRGIYPNFPDPPLVPSKRKEERATPIVARMRSGSVLFDMEADWFGTLKEQLLRFPRGLHDDYVDVMAWIGLLLDRLVEAPTDEEIEDEEWDSGIEYFGRSAICGY